MTTQRQPTRREKDDAALADRNQIVANIEAQPEPAFLCPGCNAVPMRRADALCAWCGNARANELERGR